ncbi:hypothetical protein FRC12_014617 [Ceratobasidium sp. 428]|nr:hypothetical protein FRC12_014617 [Ceratobasidium sp. 428]
MPLARSLVLTALFAPLLALALTLPSLNQVSLSDDVSYIDIWGSMTTWSPDVIRIKQHLEYPWASVPLNQSVNATMVAKFRQELGNEAGIKMIGYKAFDNGWQKYFEQDSSLCEDFEFVNGPLKCPIATRKYELAFDLTFFRDEPADTEWILEYHLTLNKSGTLEDQEFMLIQIYFYLLDSPVHSRTSA